MFYFQVSDLGSYVYMYVFGLNILFVVFFIVGEIVGFGVLVFFKVIDDIGFIYISY